MLALRTVIVVKHNITINLIFLFIRYKFKSFLLVNGEFYLLELFSISNFAFLRSFLSSNKNATNGDIIDEKIIALQTNSIVSWIRKSDKSRKSVVRQRVKTNPTMILLYKVRKCCSPVKLGLSHKRGGIFRIKNTS